MIFTTRQAFIFLLASLLLALTVALLPWSQVDQVWQAYQRDYFARTGVAGEVTVRQINPSPGAGRPTGRQRIPRTVPDLSSWLGGN